MLVYVATEKDCLGSSTHDDKSKAASGGNNVPDGEDSSPECVICLEEFEPGVRLARLECLCKFHERCILSWWRAKRERDRLREEDLACPVHYESV